MKNIILITLLFITGLLNSQPWFIYKLPNSTTRLNTDYIGIANATSQERITVSSFISTYSLSTSSITGTTNKYAKFTGSSTIGDALLSDDGTNVIVPSGKKITGATTSAIQLDFGTTGSPYFQITPDAGGYATSAYYQDVDGINLSWNGTNDGFIFIDDSRTTMTKVSGSKKWGVSIAKNAFYDGIKGGIYIADNASASFTEPGFDQAAAVSINAKSASFNSGVINSVVLGGSGLTATANSTVYVPTINIATGLTMNVGSSLNGKVLTSDASGNASWQAASGAISGTGVTGRITKWTGASTIDTSTVLKETGGDLIVTNGSLIKSANGLNSVSIGNSSSSLESDNGSGSTASLYSSGTSSGALVNDGVSLVEFYVDAPNNRARVNTTAGGEITLNSGSGGTIALTTGTLTVDGNAAIIDGNEAVGRVFTCTSGITGAGTWQAIPGLTGTTGSIISFSGTNTATNISAGAAGTFLMFAGANTLPVVSTLVLPNSATANRLAYATSTNTWGDNSLLTFDGTIFTANALKSNASGLYIGSSAASSVNIAYFKSDQNTATLHRIENASGGTAAIGGFQMHNGTSGFNVYITGTGYTTAGSLVQSSGVVDCLASGGMSISASNASGDLRFNTAGTSSATQRVKITSTGNVILNSTGSALATTATNGFTYIPTCAGTPTGVPATLPTGALPIIIDSTNNKMYMYSGGAWVALN